MTNTEFTKTVEANLELIKSMLVTKTAEYNVTEDRLSLFKKAGELQGVNADEALLGIVSKQIISIYEMAKTHKKYPIEKWNEKCIDTINYMLLLLALEKDINDTKEG